MPYPSFTIEERYILVDEPMGTKEKFWCEIGGTRWLFKHSRVNNGIPTGEDWAEKIASELAAKLGIPCAKVELADFNSSPGIISCDFARTTQNHKLNIYSHMIHGNELLSRLHDDAYPDNSGTRRVPDHTVDRVLDILGIQDLRPPVTFGDTNEISHPADVFCGYLLLDALIGNTDRHHENWAIQYIHNGLANGWYLCPSFDHASSLGRELTEQRRTSLLRSHDSDIRITRYVSRCKSALYSTPDASGPLTPRDAYTHCIQRCPAGGKYWGNKLASMANSEVDRILNQIPNHRMPDTAKELARILLNKNKERLLEVIA